MEKKPMALPKIGSGKRFKNLANQMAREGVNDPDAVAASIGIKKFSKDKMAKMAQAGKNRRQK